MEEERFNMSRDNIPEFARQRQRSLGNFNGIDPARTAAVVLDLQNFFLDSAQPMAAVGGVDMIPRVNAVTETLRSAGGVVVWTQHSFAEVANDSRRRRRLPPFAPLMEELHNKLQPGRSEFDLHPDLQVAPEDLVIAKWTPSAFHPYALTDLDERLSNRGVETVIVMGVITNGCCDCTARDAYQLNYRVIFVADANAALTEVEHDAALISLSALFAEVMDAKELVKIIEKRKSQGT
jgi:ureidoacrylate peracid hydrolase